MRSPAGSRLRARTLGDMLRVGWELAGRGQFDVMGRFYDPGCRVNFGGRGPIEMPPEIVGPAALIEAFSRLELDVDGRYRVEEVFDLDGPCFAARVERRFTGKQSDVNVADSVGCVYTMGDGLVTAQQLFYDEAQTKELLLEARRRAG